jgi:hypothetical protein
MKALIIAAGAAALIIVLVPTIASAQSRQWQMKQGVFCADGRRAITVEICKQREMRAAAAKHGRAARNNR